MLQIRRRAALILLVTGVQLLCVLVALVSFAEWLKTGLTTAVTTQVESDNRAVASQFAQLVREFGFRDVSRASPDWERLQAVVERTTLPNEGFICIIGGDGKLLYHPAMRQKPALAAMEHGATALAGTHSGTIAQLANGTPSFSGVGTVDDETHVIGGTPIPELGITVLAHQRQRGIEHAVGDLLATSRTTGILVGLALVLLTTLSTTLVVRRYENQLADVNAGLEQQVAVRTRALTRTQEAVIFGLAKLADSRDEDTGEHLVRIQRYVHVLCSHLLALGVPDLDGRTDLIVRTSALHDIGKVGVPDAILQKPGGLTAEERAVMQQHTLIGAECLRAVGQQLGEDDFLTTALEIAEGHHERWDGSGYPHRRRGAETPLPARIVALADVYDALTSARVYKAAWPHDRAMDEIVAGAGAHFDPIVVAAFRRGAAEFQTIADAGRQPTSDPGPWPGPQRSLQFPSPAPSPVRL
ncbi:MAG: HD domain-containing phosphohydrolase [Vicinamibacterales bacterium]